MIVNPSDNYISLVEYLAVEEISPGLTAVCDLVEYSPCRCVYVAAALQLIASE